MIISILKYIFLLFLNIIANLIGIIFNPFVVLFANRGGWLPNWLWWFQTPDNSLNGDIGWRTEHFLWLRNGSYLKRVLWLYRNNVHGFSTNILGFTMESGLRYFVSGREYVANRPLYEGIVFRKIVTAQGSVYFQWYWVKAWSKTRCIRVNIGWKLWSPHIGKKAQFVFSPALFMGYSHD